MPCLSLKHILRSRAIVKNGKKAQKAASLATKTAKVQASEVAKNATEATVVPKAVASQAAAKQPVAPKLIPLKPAAPNPNILTAKPVKHIRRQKPAPKPTRADLINAESRLGSQLFGPIPAGHRREFFLDHKNIWIWHEDWLDQNAHACEMTVRYEVRPAGVYKKVATGKYFRLEGSELENFRKATHAYLYVIKKYLYNRPVPAWQ